MSSKFYVERIDTSVQPWKEEIQKDAVYSIFLKKITYPSLSSQAQSNGEPDTLQGEACMKWRQHFTYVIHAGTLEKLVDSFVQEHLNTVDSSYLNVFLHTYRTFTDPITLLGVVDARFHAAQCNSELKKSYRITHADGIKTFLNAWLESVHSADFNTPPNFLGLDRMLSMVTAWQSYPLFREELHLLEGLATLRNKIGATLDRFQMEYSMRNQLFREINVDGEQSHSNENHDFHNYDEVDLSFPISGASCPVVFEHMDATTIANQLTLIDKDLFLHVIPHELLSRVRGVSAASVDVTIQQFNRLVNVVVTTVLAPQCNKPSRRAVLLVKWVEVASELRALKSFSALKAVFSGLQCHEVYRLKKCWKCVEKNYPSHWEAYMELAKIVSAENNQEFGRKILRDEGTAKFPEFDKKLTLKSKASMQSRKKHRQTTIVGTIPYMGTFLTDLTMIHNALPDHVKGTLINFDKRRKEFDVLAKVFVLQSAAKSYSISRDEDFMQWFNSLYILTEAERETRTMEVEPGIPYAPSCDGSDGSPGGSVLNKFATCPIANNLEISGTNSTGPTRSFSSGLDDLGSLSSSRSSIFSDHLPAKLMHRSTVTTYSADPVISLANLSLPNSRIVKMRLNLGSNVPSTSGVNYKSMTIDNTERTNTVIKNILEKFHMDSESSDDYCIVQILLDGREIHLPNQANVYYALDSSSTEDVIVCELRYKAREKYLGSLKERKEKKNAKKYPRKLSTVF